MEIKTTYEPLLMKAESLDIFDVKIENAIKSGWMLQGGPFVFDGIICQLLYRTTIKESGPIVSTGIHDDGNCIHYLAKELVKRVNRDEKIYT